MFVKCLHKFGAGAGAVWVFDEVLLLRLLFIWLLWDDRMLVVLFGVVWSSSGLCEVVLHKFGMGGVSGY